MLCNKKEKTATVWKNNPYFFGPWILPLQYGCLSCQKLWCYRKMAQTFPTEVFFTRNERPRKTSHLKEGWFVVGIVLSTLNNYKNPRWWLRKVLHSQQVTLQTLAFARNEKRGTPFGRDYLSSEKGYLTCFCLLLHILVFLPWKQPSWFRILFVKHQRISFPPADFSYPTQA